MGIYKEVCKFFSKIIDRNIYSSFYPKLILRNSTKMNKNNYKVSDEYAYIFVHVPKTAGMTVNSIIDEINMKLDNNKIYRGGHNPKSLFHNTDEKKYFTVIREPVERIYSFYQMSLKDKKQPYNYLAKKSLYHFVAYCSEAQNTYCKYFSGEIEKDIDSDLYNIAQKNIQNFYQILSFSNFENNLNKFLKKIGIQNMKIPHFNKSEKKNISVDDRKIIEFYNTYDLKLYNFLKSENYLE